MANIVISELRPAGFDLFSDSESYLTDLNEQEIMDTQGGLTAFSSYWCFRGTMAAMRSSVACGVGAYNMGRNLYNRWRSR